MTDLIDRRLWLNLEPQHKSLYDWAIVEVDDQGQMLGNDQIPWAWALYFTATSCALAESIEVSELEKRVAEGRIIRMLLRPGILDGSRRTTYRMFGTDRRIEQVQLDVHRLSDPSEKERCSLSGGVAYEYEVDFRNERSNDWLIFDLHVKPDTFERYFRMVSDRAVISITFRVSGVQGFYAEWSPGISTDAVKILTTNSDHKIEMPEGIEFEPFRLGKIGEAALYMNHEVDLKPKPKPRPPQGS